MDPHANLKRQRELAQAIIDTEDAAGAFGMSDEDRCANEDRARELAELVLALDDWRRRGGFDPYAPAAGDALSVEEGAECEHAARELGED